MSKINRMNDTIEFNKCKDSIKLEKNFSEISIDKVGNRPKNVSVDSEKKTNKKKKKERYSDIMNTMMKPKSDVDDKIKKDKEKVKDNTGGGTFSKIDKI